MKGNAFYWMDLNNCAYWSMIVRKSFLNRYGGWLISLKSLGGIQLLYARIPSERRRDGRLGSVLLLIQNLILLLASPLLHYHGAKYAPILTVIAIFSSIGIIGLKVPWEKLDHRANAIISISLFAEVASVSPQLRGSTAILPILLLAGFFYAGLVQDPRLLALNSTIAILAILFYLSTDSSTNWVIVGPLTTLAGLAIAGALIHNRIAIEKDNRIMSWQLASMSEVGSTAIAFDTLAYVASSCNQFLNGSGGVAATWLLGQQSTEVLVSTSFNGTDLANLVTPELVNGAGKESGFYIAAMSNEYLFVENASLSKLDRRAHVIFNYSTVIFFPLRLSSYRLGAVAVYWNRWTPRPSEEVILAIKAFLNEASRIIGAQLDREDLTERLAVDELTKLQNRRSFFTALNAMDTGDSVVFLDLDNFKMLNDTLGHSEGDRELKRLGQVLKKMNRPGDVAARYGGEEFVLLLKNSDELDARLKVEQIREAWSKVGRVTFSAGIATMVEGSNSAAVLICADRAMYMAKAKGRNRTETEGLSESESDGGGDFLSL